LHEAWGNRGNALENLGQFSEALVSFNKAIEIRPHPQQQRQTHFRRYSPPPPQPLPASQPFLLPKCPHRQPNHHHRICRFS
jgi:hypothetical protein